MSAHNGESVLLHAENGIETERTACGLTILDETGEGTGVVLLAAPGSVVTCSFCRMILSDAQENYTASFRRRRVKP